MRRLQPHADSVPPTWQSGDYLYDGAGNIYAIGTDGQPNSDANRLTYTYDTLSRLTAAATAPVVSRV
jgi:YD repeat-containing protein